MNKCSDCAHWLLARKTVYEDGSEITNYKAPEGKGHCQALDIDTAPEFGCSSFESPLTNADQHVVLATKDGAPWMHWSMGDCPDCVGKGSQNDSGCHRCTGTGKVRHYDDGHVGEERTRRHPKEPKNDPKCVSCKRDVQWDWKTCPWCGSKLDAVAPTEKVEDPSFTPPPTPPGSWQSVFGVALTWRGDVGALYREKAKICHPDAGGSDEAMTNLNVAYENARAELGQ